MLEILHQLIAPVVFPSIYTGFLIHPRWLAGILNHRQYDVVQFHTCCLTDESIQSIEPYGLANVQIHGAFK